MQKQLLGIVSEVRVWNVYACDLVSVELLSADGERRGDDITVRLPCKSKTLLRVGDPPPAAMLLYDPDAKDGHTSEALGPCPRARAYARKLLRAAGGVIVHIPIPNRRDWLDSLAPGTIEEGDLYLVPRETLANAGAIALPKPLSRLLVAQGHATPGESNDPQEQAA